MMVYVELFFLDKIKRASELITATMQIAKGGNNSTIVHQSQRQMIKKTSIVFSVHFIIFALVMLAHYSIHRAVVCFSAIIKIARIFVYILWFASFVFLLLLLNFLFSVQYYNDWSVRVETHCVLSTLLCIFSGIC